MAVATAPDPTPVFVDWSGVPDEVVARCELLGLDSLLFQGLIDSGYAVVNEVGGEGIVVRLAADAEAFDLAAEHGDQRRTGRLAIPTPCDSTIQIEIQYRLLELVAQLDVRRATVQVEPVAEQHSPWELRIAGGILFPGAFNPLGALRLSARRRLPMRITVGLVVEGSLHGGSSIVLGEPVIAAQLFFCIWENVLLRWSAGVEAGLMGHIFNVTGRAGGHADARFAVPIDLMLRQWGVGISVMPTLRTVAVRHLAGTAVAYDAQLWGIWSGAFWQWG